MDFNENGIYDRFPINLLESMGYIKREPFGFMIQSMKLWEQGKCIANQRIDAVIKGEIKNNEMHITLRNLQIERYLLNSFSFAEISHNRDRVLWSNDILSGGYTPAKNIPAYMSMFYQMGNLSKVQFSNQYYLIEFYGTTAGFQLYEQFMKELGL
ncbi:MAG: hypothetical protein IKK07_07045 [Bacteroides sp.]|nr:hypothetical protein [Bacteroides sp.]